MAGMEEPRKGDDKQVGQPASDSFSVTWLPWWVSFPPSEVGALVTSQSNAF